MPFFVWKSEGKKLLGRPRHGLKNTIKINFREIGLKGVGWILFVKVKDK
jgi:hypothetical protein